MIIMYPKDYNTTPLKGSSSAPTVTSETISADSMPIKYVYFPEEKVTVAYTYIGNAYVVKGDTEGRYTPPAAHYKHVVNYKVYDTANKKYAIESCIEYVPALPYINKNDVVPYTSVLNTKSVNFPAQYAKQSNDYADSLYHKYYDNYNSGDTSDSEFVKNTYGYTTEAPAEGTVEEGAIFINGKKYTNSTLTHTALEHEYKTYLKDHPYISYDRWLSDLRSKTHIESDTYRTIDTALSLTPKGAYTDEEIADAGVKLEQTPLQQLSDYGALSQILQSNIPKNVFTEQAVAQATALADAKTTAAQLGLPSLAEYIKLYTESADTQNAATRQALELAAAQLYDRIRKQDLEWLASQTETASKKASADSGAQAAALLETLANAKGENLESIVKNFSDNLTTAEEMQNALNEAYAAGQAQYDTGRLNIAQHTNDANAIAAQNLATIGALYEAAQQSENSFNKSKAEHATAIQDINSRAQTELASDIISLLTQQQDNEIQRRTVDSIVRNVLAGYTTTTKDGKDKDVPNYSEDQKTAVLNVLKAAKIYDPDEDQLTTDAIKLLRDATQDVDYSYLQKDATAQAVLDNKVINSVLFDPYEQARRTRTQTLDEYANSIGIKIDPRYYASLYDTAAVNAFKTYDTQRKYAEQAMLRNLITGDQSTNAPLRKRTLGAVTNNDRLTSAATQLSNAQNNAAANADAIWSAYTAEKTAPAKEAAARSKAATDALAYYQNLMTGYESGGTGGVLQQLNNANKNSADNLATYGSLAQQGMAGLAALNDANTSITNANADARATYQGNINTLNKNRSIQNLREQAFAKQANVGAQLGKYNISIN